MRLHPSPPAQSDTLPLFAQRHTAENIEKWTEEALTDMGLTPAALLAP